MTKDEVLRVFGVDPDSIGIRNRGWCIVDADLDEEEKLLGVKEGYLCVLSRDGDMEDPDARKYDTYIGSIRDITDMTYRYYYFRPRDER